MNKLFAIAFMCIYLLMSVGVAKTTHYCMGREKSTNFFSFESEKCLCSLFLPENSPCCNDEHEVLIVDDSQTHTASLAVVSPEFFELGDVLHIKPEQIFVYASIQFINDDFSDGG